MEIESIDSKEKLLINSSKTTRYLGYPRKVPLWMLFFSLPKLCKLYRDENNSDISLEIENYEGKAYVPALSSQEAIERLYKLIPELKDIYKTERI